jgi:hypothetical protein
MTGTQSPMAERVIASARAEPRWFYCVAQSVAETPQVWRLDAVLPSQMDGQEGGAKCRATRNLDPAGNGRGSIHPCGGLIPIRMQTSVSLT